MYKMKQDEIISAVNRLVLSWFEKSKQSLYYFCKVVLGYKDMLLVTHKWLCDLLEDDSKKRKLILMPRGTFKTSIIGIGYPIWYLLFRNPDKRFLIVSDTYTNASKVLFKIKFILENNEKLRLIFGDLRGKRWREDEIDISLRKNYTKEPNISCASPDTTRVGQHYDIIILDDVVTDVNTQTEEQMRKTVEYFKTLFSILEPDGMIVINGTRWSNNRWELYQYILDNLKTEFDIYIKQAIDKHGHVFFPTRLSKEKLAEINKLQGSYIFACQYLNNPISPDEQIFSHIKTFDSYNEISLKDLDITITVDPAISLDRGDYTGIVVCGTDSRGVIYVLDALRFRAKPSDLIEALFFLADRWAPRVIGIETVAFQKSLKYYFEEAQIKKQKFLSVIELKPSPDRSKFMRIVALQPYLEREQMVVYSKLNNLLEELMAYPRSNYDDLVDALAYQLDIVNSSKPQTEEKMIMDEYEQYLEARRQMKAVKPPFRYRFLDRGGEEYD